MAVVASYNIRLGVERGLAAVGDVVEELGADLLVLQEVGDRWIMGEPVDQTGVLAARAKLEHSRHVVAIIQDEVHCYGHALIAREPLRDVVIHSLPQIADEPRTLVEAVATLDDEEVIVIATHLSHRDSDRPAQLEALAALVSAHDDSPRLLVLGDLNEIDADKLAPLIAAGRLTDHGAGRGMTYPATDPRERRDVILSRGFEASSPLEVIISDASDHRPIRVTLRPEDRWGWERKKAQGWVGKLLKR